MTIGNRARPDARLLTLDVVTLSNEAVTLGTSEQNAVANFGRASFHLSLDHLAEGVIGDRDAVEEKCLQIGTLFHLTPGRLIAPASTGQTANRCRALERSIHQTAECQHCVELVAARGVCIISNAQVRLVADVDRGTTHRHHLDLDRVILPCGRLAGIYTTVLWFRPKEGECVLERGIATWIGVPI